MLKQLKLKFIINNMFLVCIALAAIFTSLCILNFFLEENKITDALENNLEEAEKNLYLFPNIPSESDKIVFDTELTVLVSSNGTVTSATENELEKSFLNTIVSRVIDSEYERGTLRGTGLSFMKHEITGGMLISFISREHLSERLREAVAQSCLGCFVSLLLFLYISKRLADIAIAPVEKAWQQQKQFLADASHDLKTPLTVILANNNILSAHKEDTVESQMKWIESTSEEAGRMSDLINKMLELAKSEATHEELRLRETDISEVVENAILQFEVVAFEKNITIESGIQPGIIVTTHRQTLAKVLEILFDNAVKYSPENEKISVALFQSSKKAIFTITNNGECIKEDELTHIFERFYRTSKEREVGGHGLGLSLAKKKCDMIGAKISVESDPYDGTTFTVTMKCKNK